MNPMLRISLFSGVMLSLLIGCGGGDEFQEFSTSDIKPADPGAHDHHHHHGEEHVAPHGGTLVELGDHQYHAEIAWDEKAKTITLYVLDGEAENAVPISATELVLYVDTDDEGTPYKLVAKPQPGDGDDGKSSRFVTTDKDAFEKYHDDDSADGEIELSIGEKTYKVGVTHEEHDHDHGDHKHDEKGDHKHDKKGDHDKDEKATGK